MLATAEKVKVRWRRGDKRTVKIHHSEFPEQGIGGLMQWHSTIRYTASNGAVFSLNKSYEDKWVATSQHNGFRYVHSFPAGCNISQSMLEAIAKEIKAIHEEE